MKTIKDIEAELTEKLFGPLKDLDLLPGGYQHRVRLHGKTNSKRRTASFDTSWSPKRDSIYISFEQTSERLQADTQPFEHENHEIRRCPSEAPHLEVASEPAKQAAATTSPNCEAQSSPVVTDRLSDLIRALNHAESRPGYQFVALKWFRDTALPGEGFPWAKDDSTRYAVLRDAIDKRFILTSRLPNPRSPQYPVTAIRLNRLMPEVRMALGNQDEMPTGFQPLSIRGESLSQTVLRGRR
ncbi:MAG: hypothetical protein ACRD11_09525 [Terriglobia bacterium]